LIAGLSDMLKQQSRSSDPQTDERLSLIASVSRRSVDAMSDIVWAINPNRDHLSDLAQRMRRFASEVFSSRGIRFRFDAPDSARDTRITADVRREVFLIFKEGANNAARHSCCTEVEITLRIDRGMLVLKLSDNGKGIDATRADGGEGMFTMRKRAEKLGGKLTVISSADTGTTLILNAFLK